MSRLGLDKILPISLAVIGAAAVAHWLLASAPSNATLTLRIPVPADYAPDVLAAGAPRVDLVGTFYAGSAVPALILPGEWPEFRGPQRDNVSRDSTALSRDWSVNRPSVCWTVEMGEGYAGAAIHAGRVYVLDYNTERRCDAIRCLSLNDGRELWRREYAVDTGRNHGITRTVPAIAAGKLVTFGPKCHVVCVDAMSGEFAWGLDLVRDFGARVPEWYAGQCPVIDDGKVILGVGGPEALVMAVDLQTGKVLWKTPNPLGWQMTHASIAIGEIGGAKTIVYSASGGVAGINAADGSVLWQTSDWRVAMATVATPIVLDSSRLLLTGGYGAGAMLMQVPQTTVLKKFKPAQLGAEQQTPIRLGDAIYAIIPGGQLVCLDLQGVRRWASGTRRFGLGPFIVVDGLILAMSDNASLTAIEANPEAYREVGHLPELIPDGHEAWGPMAIAGGRLIARDLTRMVCVDLRPAMAD